MTKQQLIDRIAREGKFSQQMTKLIVNIQDFPQIFSKIYVTS